LDTTFDYTSQLDDLQVEFILRATEAHSNGRQLQAPKAMVLNGESAILQVQTEQTLKTDSEFTSETIVNQTTTVTNSYFNPVNEEISTGVQLSINPVITADKKFVILRIQTQLEDLISQATGTAIGFNPVTGEQLSDNYVLPTTQSTSVMTRVTVPDRGTVMLGGLTITAVAEKESGVPVLAKLPVLGRFFSNRSVVDDKYMLLVLVKPSIILQDEAEEDALGALAARR